MEVAYTPAPCEGKDAKFKGMVVMRPLSYDERADLMLETGMADLMNGGESLEEVAQNQNKQYLGIMSKLAKASYPQYVKVDIKGLENKRDYKSVDDLKYDPDAQAIIQDVAMKVALGFKMGNASGPASKSK